MANDKMEISFDNDHLVKQDDQADCRSMSRIIEEANRNDLGGRRSTTPVKESKMSIAMDIFNKVDMIDKMS